MNHDFLTDMEAVPANVPPAQTDCGATDSVTAEARRRARVVDCYRHPGGPLLGWLTDEAKGRGHTGQAMAEALGVTAGYIHQLRSGHRQLAHISDSFARACSKYIGVPPVVVKLLSGRIALSDFLQPRFSETELIDRAFRSILADPSMREVMPVELEGLTHEARRALVMLYAEVTHFDLFGARELPNILHYLQRAAVVHDENLEMAEHGLGEPV